MIKDAWKNTIPLCGFCDTQLELDINQGFQYKCPKCKNKISSLHFEKILDKIAVLDEEKYLRKEIGSLVGEKFIVGKAIKCEIIEDDENGHFKINIKNLERSK